jgi:Zn finger protein HypA/HybF involved in hydrogenase expression
MSIVQALIEQVESEIERAGQTGRVTRLELAIGTLSGSCRLDPFRL